MCALSALVRIPRPGVLIFDDIDRVGEEACLFAVREQAADCATLVLASAHGPVPAPNSRARLRTACQKLSMIAYTGDSPLRRTAMRRVLVRYKLKPGRTKENENLVRAVYAELRETAPASFRYATFKAGDDLTFFHLASIEAEAGNPLADSVAFKAFQADIRNRCDEPPAPVDLSLIDAFGFFDR